VSTVFHRDDGSGAAFLQKTPGEALFERLHHHRGIAALGLAEQQINVLGHDHVANHHEAVTTPHLFHDFEKQITILWRAEQWASLVAAGRNKVKISGAVVSDAGWSASGTSITALQVLSVTNEQGIEVRGAHSSKTTTSGAASAVVACGPARHTAFFHDLAGRRLDTKTDGFLVNVESEYSEGYSWGSPGELSESALSSPVSAS
jgi:hypothetical protein